MVSHDDTQRDLGLLESRMTTVEKSLVSMAADVRETRDAVVGAKGGWKTLVAVGALSAAFTTGAIKLAPFLWGLPK